MTPRDHDPRDGDRDELLGAALRELPVPDHAPGFAQRLRSELRATPDAPTPTPTPARPRRGRPPRARARRRLAPGLALAAAACAVVLSLVLPGGTRTPGGGRLGVEPATAAQLAARVTQALAHVRALEAVLVVRERPASDAPFHTTRAHVLLTSAGDVAIEGDELALAYHADSGSERLLRDPHVPGPVLTSGLAPGAPDRAADRTAGLQLGTVARALRAAGRARVHDMRLSGRRAWRISVPAAVDVHALAGETGDRLDIVVDRVTGIPLRVRETYRGRFVREQRLERVRLNPRIPARVFAPLLPSGAQEIDAGFRMRPLAEASGTVGYAPLAPRWLPTGFERAETAVAAQAGPTGAEGMNPPSVDVVSTAYRRGLQAVIVTTRRVGADPRAWADPLAAPEGFLVEPRRVCFARGALAGRCGQQLVAPRATPHVWAMADGLVVTVAGDLTATELRRVAESLAPLR